MPNRRRSFAPRQRKTQNLSWAGIEIAPTIIAASAKVVLGSFILSTEWDETIMRSRGEVVYTSDQVAAIETPTSALGMMVVSEDAFAAGVGAGALPGPVTDISFDEWFFWLPLTGYADSSGKQPNFISFDQKGKRIVRQGSRVMVMAEGQDAAASQGGFLAGYIRILGMFRS